MRGSKRIRRVLMVLCLACLMMSGIPVSAKESKQKEVTVAFTHDLHSHLEAFYLEEGDEEKEVGGFARIMAHLGSLRAEDENLLYLDGGDFSMGTLYQTVYMTQAAELRMLGYLGADVTTFGNHEFDYRSEGLAKMLGAAKSSGDAVPPLVVCNVDWETTLNGEKAEDGKLLQKAFDDYGVKPYIMLEKNGVKIAVIGVFGKDSLECAPTCALSFKDPIEAVKETVEQIEEKEDADMLVCVSHSGTWEDEKRSEDELLAKAVPQLDLIVSGHTHSILEEPIVHGDTAIVSTGEYGARVGSLRMVQKEEGRWQVEDYRLTLMDKEITGDSGAAKKIEELGETIDAEYLKQFGYTKNQVLTYNPWEFAQVNGLGEVLQEETLGNLLADAFLYTMNNSDTGDENQTVIAVVPSGCIRDTFREGQDVTAADAFQSLSLGIGLDGIPGYPLVSVYVTGKELKTAAEVDASISPMMPTAQLYFSGLSYTANPSRMILNKVTEVRLQDMYGNIEDLEDDKLYRLVADLYSGQMLGAVSEKSYGILSLIPKDADGNEIAIEDLEDRIVYVDGRELKAWACVAEYLNSFGKDAGIPDAYSKPQGRKVIVDDGSVGAVLKDPNGIAMAAYGIVAAVVIILVLIIVAVVKWRKRTGKKQSK